LISADLGVWLAFLRNEPFAAPLERLLDEERVCLHPFVLTGLRLRLRGAERGRVLGDLERLPVCFVDSTEEASVFIAEHDLSRFDIDIVGAYLLAAAAEHGDQVWASDPHLRVAAAALELAFDPARA
jgi:hypothetical protein